MSAPNRSILRRIFYPSKEAGAYYSFMEYFRVIFLALLIAGTIRSFLFEPYKIPSSSMMPTLLVGDYLFISKYSYGTRIPFTETVYFEETPERGDVVVFRKAINGNPKTTYIKRIVGLPGDKISYNSKHLHINGEKIPYSYVGKFITPYQGRMFQAKQYEEDLLGVKHDILIESIKDSARVLTATVPQGKYVVMGDNRDNSFDSRAWNHPYWSYVEHHELLGRAEFLFWSWDESFIPRFDRMFDTLRPEKLIVK